MQILDRLGQEKKILVSQVFPREKPHEQEAFLGCNRMYYTYLHNRTYAILVQPSQTKKKKKNIKTITLLLSSSITSNPWSKLFCQERRSSLTKASFYIGKCILCTCVWLSRDVRSKKKKGKGCSNTEAGWPEKLKKKQIFHGLNLLVTLLMAEQQIIYIT